MKRLRWMGVSLALALCLERHVGAVEFRQAAALLPCIGTIEWADFDGDGDLDMVLSGQGASGPRSELNRQIGVPIGTPVFELIDLPQPQANASGPAAWGDFDADGDADLLLVDGAVEPYRTWLLRNDGAGLAAVELAFTGANGAVLRTGDYDRDGDLDVLLCGTEQAFGPAFTRIFLNDGTGRFTNSGLNLPGAFRGASQWADFDADGDLDVWITGNTEATGSGSSPAVGSLFRHEADDSLTLVTTNLAGLHGADSDLADLDGDGDLDLVVSGQLSNAVPFSAVLRNEGALAFSVVTNVLPALRDGPLAFGDADTDGRPDLLLGGAGAGTAAGTPVGFYPNDGLGGFGAPQPIADAGVVNGGHAAWADVDRDGRLDFAAAMTSLAGSALSRIWLNLNAPSNAPPSAPTGLAATLDGSEVLLEWDAAQDDGGSSGLTYNLRVGRAPNLADVLPAHSDWVTGRRGLAAPGNCGPRRWARLRLTTGTYYWSVQAVDGGFVGGQFAAERPFSVPPAAPRVCVKEVRPGSIGTAMVDGAVHPNGATATWWAEWAENRAGAPTNLVPGGTAAVTNGFAPIHAPLSGLSLEQPYRLWFVASNVHGISRSLEFPFRLTNQPPTVAGLSNATGFPGRPLQLVFAVSDPDGDPAAVDLSVSVRQLDQTNVLEIAHITLGGEGTDRTLTLTSNPGVLGRTQVTVTARDPLGGVASRSFQFEAAYFERVPGYALEPGLLGDFNNDGRWDYYEAPSGGMLLQGATGGLLATPCTAASFAEADPATLAADFDEDGWLDVLRITESGIRSRDPSRLVRNTGDWGQVEPGMLRCGLQTLMTGLPGGYGITLAVADHDNDGDADLVLAGAGGTVFPQTPQPPTPVGLWENGGAGHLVASPNPFPWLSEAALAWGDYDNDGDVDLALCGVTTNGSLPGTFLFRNNGSGQFTPVPQNLAGVWNGAAGWGDFDNDGDLDLALTGCTNRASSGLGPSTLRLYRNDSGSFVSVPMPQAAALCGGELAWADVDTDGDRDLLVAGLSSSTFQAATYLVLQDPPGAFVLAGRVARSGDRSLHVGDLDGDGGVDVLATGGDSAGNYLRNLWESSNAPPAAPTQLRAELSNGEVRFRWAAAADVNQAGGLSYNLRVGTAPGQTDVVSGMADPVTGRRRVFAAGNAGPNTFWRWPGPTVGTYYWSVQAIDHGLAASAFAPEQVLVLNELPPVLIRSGVRDLTSVSAYLEGEFLGNGQPCSWWFEWGETGAYGAQTPVRTTPPGNGAFLAQAALVDLPPLTSFHARLVVSNQFGVQRGLDLTFTTSEPSPFALLSSMLPPAGRAALAWADFDADDDLDLVEVPLSTNGFPMLYRGDGSGFFTPEVLVQTNYASASLRWADFEGDGDLDLFLSGTTVNGRVLSYFFRNEAAALIPIRLPMAGPPGSPAPEADFGASAWGDFDHDGDPDPLRSYGYSAFPGILKNLGRGSYAPFFTPSTFMDPIAWADVNGDGEWDVVEASQNQCLIRLATDAGRWTHQAIPVLGWVNTDSFWRDWDWDGDVDALIAAGTPGSSLSSPQVFLNDGSGKFGPATLDLPGQLLGWGDLDADGRIDPVSVVERNLRIWVRPDGATFVALNVPLVAVDRLTFAPADFDNDGRLDFVVTGDRPSTTNRLNQLYRNTLAVTNHLPSAPAQLGATVRSNEVRLTWEASADPDQAGGLTYNVRVGTSPNTQNVLNAWANPQSGYRRLPQPGNAGLRQELRLVQLFPGTYYWSVQALDEQFAGSPFAVEGTFVIAPETAPQLSLTPTDTAYEVRLAATAPGWLTIETSSDLRSWHTVRTNYLGPSLGVTYLAPTAEEGLTAIRGRLEPR